MKRRITAVVATFALLEVIAACGPDPPRAQPIDGSRANALCPNFALSYGIGSIDVPDPGWVLVDPSREFRSATGRVTLSRVTHTDFPAAHDSHDHNTLIELDIGTEDILSDVGHPNDEDAVAVASDLLTATTLEVEWEIGTFPNETGRSAPERTFPRWAWPSVGDRVWMDGSWIFDCGHGKKVGGVVHRRTEIHPARAVASMREQVKNMPGFGPMLVTATDLYIHGHSGVVTDILECSPLVLIDEGTCGLASEPHRGVPIDEDFEFDMRLPLKLTNASELQTLVEIGPGNTIAVQPEVEKVGNHLHVTVPLAGTGAQPGDVYARRIYAGWTETPSLRRFRVSVDKIDLHEDLEFGTDCECTFFWVNLDRAANEWFRLVDFQIPTYDDGGPFCPEHTNTMNDWDDDHICGNGELEFSGPSWDFLVMSGVGVPQAFTQSFTLRTRGYDQDCLDDHFGDHNFVASTFLDCYAAGNGDNNPFQDLVKTFKPPLYGEGSIKISNPGGEFDLYITIDELPV